MYILSCNRASSNLKDIPIFRYMTKKREINVAYCDRVVQHVLCDGALAPYFKNMPY